MLNIALGLDRQAFSSRSFDGWWHLRLFGSLDHYYVKGRRVLKCKLCNVEFDCLRAHLEADCVVFAVRGQVEGWEPSTCFSTPTRQQTFIRILAAVDGLVDDTAPG